jgi:hypothetical protein
MNALVNAVLDFTKAIRDKFQGGAAGKILDGENGLKHGLKPVLLALFRGDIDLQETLVGFPLHPDKIRNIGDLFDLPEIFS